MPDVDICPTGDKLEVDCTALMLEEFDGLEIVVLDGVLFTGHLLATEYEMAGGRVEPMD